MRNHPATGRTLLVMAERDETPRRLAAVIIPIFANPPHDVVFVERARHLRRHAGQIAFPGGALDAGDDGDLARAALREVHEEIGIPPAAITIVGELAPIVQRQNIFTVTSSTSTKPRTRIACRWPRSSRRTPCTMGSSTPKAARSRPRTSTTARFMCGGSPAACCMIS